MPRPWKKTTTRKTTKTTTRTFEPEEVVGSSGAELRAHAATSTRKFTRTTSRKYVPGQETVVPVEQNTVMYMRMRFSYSRISLQIHKVF